MVGAQFPLPQFLKLIQQELEKLMSVENQLIMKAKDGSGERRFRNLMGRALILTSIVAVAVPVGFAAAYFSAEF